MRLERLPALAMAGVVLAALVALKLWWHVSLGDLIGQIRGAGGLGWVGLVALQTLIAVSGILPASTIGMAAGAVYGPWRGFALAATGLFLGAAIAFRLSRSMFRPLLGRIVQARPWVGRLDAAIARDGWKAACLLRLSPIMPFVVASYVMGVSSMSARAYAVGTLASLPALFGYVLIGTLIQTGAQEGLGAWQGEGGLIRIGLLVVGSAATLLLVGWAGRRWRLKGSD